MITNSNRAVPVQPEPWARSSYGQHHRLVVHRFCCRGAAWEKMATSVGSEPSIGSFVRLPMEDSSTQLLAALDDATTSSGRRNSSRGADEPLPNPPFVFPARPSSPSTEPVAIPRTTRRRPMSAIESPISSFGLSAENADRPSLPAFSFNPGASLPTPQSQFLLGLPVSPLAPGALPSPNRPAGHGHRRGGSEFVGGRLREGNSIAVMSTSPTKSESGFATTNFQPLPRRGHRRGVSGAISTNDLPTIPSPFELPRGNSAPTSPTGFDRRDGAAVPSQEALPPPADPEPIISKQEAAIEPEPKPIHTPAEVNPQQAKLSARMRVGFSDTLEFIPRPLSVISSETSSTVTARRGHSVSDSISSIVSAASPGRVSPIPLSRSPTLEMSDSRPSTAGAILDRAQEQLPTSVHRSLSKRRNSIPALVNVADPTQAQVNQSEPSPTKTSKRWSFFASTGSVSPVRMSPRRSGSSESTPKAPCTGPSPQQDSECVGEVIQKASTKHDKTGKKNKKKKKKKVKGWAGAILPRKPKGHGKRSKSNVARPPTPPASVVPLEDDEEMDPESEFGFTTPTVLITESLTPPRTAEPWKGSAEEASYPMIDLDAALGPFNTPLPHNPEWEAAQRAAGNTGKRRLHSAQGLKGFSGPGMHYHRRAESAPDLPPFDPGRAGIHRFGSSSTMADVFEEDEEEDSEYGGQSQSDSTDDDSDQNDASDGEATPPAVHPKELVPDVQDAVSTHSTSRSTSHSFRRSSSGLSDKDQASAQSVRAERSRTSLHDDVIAEEMPSVIFRTANVFRDVTDTSGSSTPSPRRYSSNHELSPVDVSPLHLPTPANVPVSPYSHASSFPSPRSPMSVDVQRMSTAPSSVSDENNFRSLLMGEPGPEVRISVDYDIPPSLTSSNSTMTRESYVPGPRMSQPTLREQRPVSVSSAFGRRRSSLASLSRLISSSHGERSKLSMEVTLDNETDGRKVKGSKKKRLGRKLQFWKPHKEDAAS